MLAEITRTRPHLADVRQTAGARVTVEAGGKRQIAEVAAGGSYYSQSELALYFGLGRASRVERLTVRWPSGNVQVFRDVEGNRTVKYRE